jgi:hypothetical protein
MHRHGAKRPPEFSALSLPPNSCSYKDLQHCDNSIKYVMLHLASSCDQGDENMYSIFFLRDTRPSCSFIADLNPLLQS